VARELGFAQVAEASTASADALAELVVGLVGVAGSVGVASAQ
jgi:hypothetical protein